jgi:uncharacterized protein
MLGCRARSLNNVTLGAIGVPDSVVIAIRVTPGSRRNEVIGWSGDELRIRLRAPPMEGRANEALRRFLAQQLDIPHSAVEIIAGITSRRKRLRFTGMSEQELKRRLGAA